MVFLEPKRLRVSSLHPQAKEKKPSTVLFIDLFKKALPIWAAGAKPEETTIEPGSMEALAAVSNWQLHVDSCYFTACQAITQAGKPQEKDQASGGLGTMIAALQIYGIAVAVAEAPGAKNHTILSQFRII